MRSVTTTFQLSMYAMLLMSCLMLAFAEGAVLPQGLSIPLIVLAWLFNERFGVLRLPLWAANVLGLAAFALALLELMNNSIEARLLAGAHLLVYLSWVVLFQKKAARHYWWTSALSVLQVAVGSVLTTSALYGLLLLIYFCGMIWTLSLFSLWQMQERFREDEEREKTARSPDAPAAPAAPADLEKASAGLPVVAIDHFAALRQTSQTRGTLHVDPDERWLGMRFALGSGMTAAGSLVMATLFFMFIPRFWVGSVTFGSEAVQPGVRSLTGFTEKVRLGDIGRIMESTEPVLQMKLFDNDTDSELSAEEYAHSMGWEEPLFRGAVLSTYERGDWSAGQGEGLATGIAPHPIDQPRVRQEITMQPIGTSILLAMHPVREARVAGGVQLVGEYRARGVLLLSMRTRPRTPLSYVAYSPVPGKDPLGMGPQRSHLRGIRSLCLRMPANLDGLRKEAERVAGIEENQPRPPNEEMAQRFVHWLRDSGEFAYSLDSSVQDHTLDPVEDFLLLRKQGHCEYYASALALMLRAVGIPSRMVSGFKGGKVNRISGAYEVEQRHAHAWVEALIDDRWATLDATPGNARTESVEALESEMPAFRDLLTFAREIWSSYVVNMTINHQRSQFYSPFQEILATATDAMTGESSGKPGLLKRLADFFSSPQEWISLKGGVASFALLCCGATLVWASRRILRALRGTRFAGGADRAALRKRVEFYERFRRLCGAAGLSRQPGETQREFGQIVGDRWQAMLSAAQLNGVPSGLTESFYRVRFGETELGPEEAADLDRTLARLEAAVRKDQQ